MAEPGYADPGYFDALYARDPDPWRFATSDYEREKYQATLDALPAGRFARAFEIGCSIGVLTRQLAPRCDDLLAVDIAAAALEQAKARCGSGVRFQMMDLRTEWPDGAFDLILMSEVLYYLGIDGIHRAAARVRASLSPGGTVALVNWHGPTDGACSGDEAAELFLADCAGKLMLGHQRRAEKYRIDVLTKPATP